MARHSLAVRSFESIDCVVLCVSDKGLECVPFGVIEQENERSTGRSISIWPYSHFLCAVFLAEVSPAIFRALRHSNGGGRQADRLLAP